MSLPTAANKRFFTTANEQYNNKMVVEIIRKNFPEYKDVLPGGDVEGGSFPVGGTFGTNNERSKEVLGMEYHGLEKTVVDTVNSFKAVSQK